MSLKEMCIPIGISNFAEIRENGYYYVDKSGLIRELLARKATKVTLITRPRRFGKTMAMSMLANFFDVRKDSAALFEGLEVAKDTALCQQWRNQWPVLFLTLKDIDGLDFSSAKEMLQERIARLCKTHSYLARSEQVDPNDRKVFQRLADLSEGHPTDAMLKTSVPLLMQMMQDHFGKPVILLIDEYDVPLEKASSNGYYEEMLGFLKSLISTALKDNDSLRFAVITGCLRIAKESIFTGTNNFVSDTITDSRLNEYFGFTHADVDRLLADTGATDHAKDVKAWYDGYHFGDLDIYCPWGVMNYLQDLQDDPQRKPRSYWRNVSGNEIIRSFIDEAGDSISEKLELLLSGGYIVQPLDEGLTYDEIHTSEDNMWSILYLTGYLTKVRDSALGAPLDEGMIALTIPNAEVKDIFQSTIKKWFDDHIKTRNRSALFDAVWSGNTEALTEEMSDLLYQTISYHDYREDFYHAFLAGIFTGAGYIVRSNREHGEGRSDVVIRDRSQRRVAIFEAKYSKTPEAMRKDCHAALQQIKDRKYAKDYEDGRTHIFCYGIAFYKKECLISR